MPGRETIHRRPRIEELWFGKLGWAATRDGGRPAARFAGFIAPAKTSATPSGTSPNKRAPIRTISIGNLTVGGNGKTPFTLFLASRLQAQGMSVGDREPRLRPQRRGRIARRAGFRWHRHQTFSRRGRRRTDDDGEIVSRTHRRRAPPHRWNSPPQRNRASRCDRSRRRLSTSRVGARRRPGADQSRARLRQWPSDSCRTDARAAARDSPRRRRHHRVEWNSRSAERDNRAPDEGDIARSLRCTRRCAPRLWCTMSRATGARCRSRWRGGASLAVSGLADPSGFYAMLHEIDTDLVGVLEYPDHHVYNSLGLADDRQSRGQRGHRDDDREGSGKTGEVSVRARFSIRFAT